MSTMILHLAKENFKFSVAHFLIFDEKSAERLHGHNYKVKVSIAFEQGIGQNGYSVDFQILKKIIKSELDRWDEHVLLPGDHPEMKFNNDGSSLEVHFRDRRYVFPQNEVILLPLQNTSVEGMSSLLAHDFYKKMKTFKVQFVEVLVEESHGQGASTRVDGNSFVGK